MAYRQSLLMLLLLCGVAACRLDATPAMHDAIAMGPFTFSVERAYEDAWASESRCGTIVIDLRLLESRHAKVHFDDFMNDMTAARMIIHPAAELVDRDGHRYIGLVSRVAGRDEWRGTFALDYEESVWSEPTCAATRNPADFRLAVRNPDVRAGQPARVSVVLG